MSYSRAQLLDVAKKDIDELVRIIDIHRSDARTLEIAIEILGEEAEEEFDIAPILKRFLAHIHLLVRESAMNAVLTFYEGKIPPKDIVDRLRVISRNDPSADLREFAGDLLEKFGE